MNTSNRLFRAAGYMLCMLSLLLALTISAYAEETKIVPGKEEEITIPTSTDNSSYVYVNAEVPEGWGGEIEVTFHSIKTGRDESVTLSYLANEYRNGLWLRFGKYQVTVNLPEDDGMCLVSLKNPDQEIIDMIKDEDLTLTICAEENPDYEFVIPTLGEDFVPPLEKPESSQELPEAPMESIEDEKNPDNLQETTDVQIETEEASTEWLAYLILGLLILIVLIVVVLLIAIAYKENDSEY